MAKVELEQAPVPLHVSTPHEEDTKSRLEECHQPCKLGRRRHVVVVTIFAPTDDKCHLLDCPDLVEVHALDARKDLVTQWEAMEGKQPDIILSKLNTSLSRRTMNADDEAVMSRYEALRSQKEKLFEALEVVPMRAEKLLTDRCRMQDFVESICAVVNTTLIQNKMEGNGGLHNGRWSSLSRGSVTQVTKTGFACLRPKTVKIEMDMVEATQDSFDARENSERSSATNGTASYHCFERESKIRSPNTLPDLPPFPLIVKPTITSINTMALVLDVESLQHFRASVTRCSVIVEEYVPHNNTLFKVSVIGKDIFVVRRPSFPDLEVHTKEGLMNLSEMISGKFVVLEESKVGGYLTFSSNRINKRGLPFSSQMLEDCSNLDQSRIRLLASAISRQLKLDLFGIDIVISEDDVLYVLDVNALPAYRGFPEAGRRVCKYLVEVATRRAFQEDCHRLLPRDILDMCIFYNKEWRDERVSLQNLKVRQIAANRIFEVNFLKPSDHSDIKSQHTLVKFNTTTAPKRFLHDEANFASNLCKKLSKLSGNDSRICQCPNVETVYYGKKQFVGMVRGWTEGKTFQDLLWMEDYVDKFEMVFKRIGRMIAKFHMLIYDKEIQTDVLDRHFPGTQNTAVIFKLVEEWRGQAVLSLLFSGIKKSKNWKSLYDHILYASRNLPTITSKVFNRMQTPEALKLIFGHFDCNTSNIIISGYLEDPSTVLIDEEWAGPNIAIYDFAKLISSVSLMIARGTTSLTRAMLEKGVEWMVEMYFEAWEGEGKGGEVGMDTKEPVRLFERKAKPVPSGKDRMERKDAFVKDAWSFVPLVALTNCFSNIIHASKEGQLASTLDEDVGLFKWKDGQFNWLRHADDHCTLYREGMAQRLLLADMQS